ncbi:SDR family oxidoreductase [Volucribacter amazonae]|uniref:Oxidoreductase n=1 Tax=Volucribacter amazonae TaxID=256731 RepID=A0A9X4PDG6_9PAST|nr:SDR family oxidoreductase [Volucribacter amazonae]MDG6895356.1 oxidoreductase [Volucribacter amazonae]
MNNIENKVVLITGASSGLGEETARHLVQQGAKVILVARRLARLQQLAQQLGISEQHCVQADVADLAQMQAAAQRALELYGRIDVLLNNAGVMPLSLLQELKVDEWNQIIDINIRGVLHGIAAVLPTMQQQQSGQIINVSSVAGHVWGPMCAVYSASKAAVRAISESLRKEVKPYNIRTTILSPGAVASELKHGSSSAMASQAMEHFYSQNEIPADSFARCVAFAISQPEEVDINEIIFRPTRQEV